MTEDERLIMSTIITLNGYELYNRWSPTQGIWQPTLVGSRVVEQVCVCIAELSAIDGSRFVTTPMRLNFNSDWVRMRWAELTDKQLSEFHRVVKSNC